MTGKALAMLLRHDPARFGVVLDRAGWGDVAAVAAGLGLDVAAILHVISEDEKGRFVLSEDGARVRAAQGHSFEVDLGLVPREPPLVLWHGTHSAVLERVMAGAMWAAGTPFYRSENGVWLVDAVTPGFLARPRLGRGLPPEPGERAAA